MRYSVIIEPVHEPGFIGYFYARIPALDLTTHGEGVEGALAAARELAHLWITERQARGEAVPRDEPAFLTQIELGDAVLSS